MHDDWAYGEEENNENEQEPLHNMNDEEALARAIAESMQEQSPQIPATVTSMSAGHSQPFGGFGMNVQGVGISNQAHHDDDLDEQIMRQIMEQSKNDK